MILPFVTKRLSCCLGGIRCFDLLDFLQQHRVILFGVAPEVSPLMAVGAKSDHGPGIVGATVTEPQNVMRFEIWHSSRSDERRIFLALFTLSLGASQDVILNISTALEDGSRCRALLGLLNAGCISFSPQLIKAIVGRDYITFEVLNNLSKRDQVKNDCVSHLAIRVTGASYFVTFADHFTPEGKSPSPFAAEDKQAFPIGGVVEDGAIATLHLHVSDAPHSEIINGTVRVPLVIVPVLQSSIAGDQKNHGVAARGNDAWSGLAAEALVNINFSIVNFTDFKSPRHPPNPPLFSASLAARPTMSTWSQRPLNMRSAA